MKRYLTLLLSLASATAWSQIDTGAHNNLFPHAPYECHSVQLTASLGFIDSYRDELKMPAGFEKNNTSGYANIAAKVEYGFTRAISLAANFGYDAFTYNIDQLYTGNNGTVKRYKMNNFREFHLGLVAYWHLGNAIHIKRLDPFIGAGPSLSNTRYSAYPQGDSTIIKIDHNVTLYVKAGARYYLSDRFSLFGDVGYEKQSIFSLGFSCRFFHKK